MFFFVRLLCHKIRLICFSLCRPAAAKGKKGRGKSKAMDVEDDAMEEDEEVDHDVRSHLHGICGDYTTKDLKHTSLIACIPRLLLVTYPL